MPNSSEFHSVQCWLHRVTDNKNDWQKQLNHFRLLQHAFRAQHRIFAGVKNHVTMVAEPLQLRQNYRELGPVHIN